MKLTIRAKILGGVTVVVLLMIGAGIANRLALESVGANFDVVTTETTPTLVTAGRLLAAVLEADRAVERHSGAAAPEEAKQLADAVATALRALADTRAELDRLFGIRFDHLFAILPEFGLRAFQEPTGSDIGRLG